jgi:signal transduction histidine kinase
MASCPPMSTLHDLLSARRDEVMQRWKTMVQGSIAPEGMSTVELVDHLPGFLDEMIRVLRADVGASPPESAPDPASTAADHGEQRLRLGFSLDAVVREYGALRDAIVETANAAGLEMTVVELQSIFTSTVNGIAHAVSEYTRQRDAELHRQHNEHIAFIAHELRNPLASVTVAFDVLKAKGHIPADARASVALGRGVERMRELIDHSLGLARTASGIELKREKTRLLALLEDAELAADTEAEAKAIKIHTAVEADGAMYVDVRLMRSALHNVLRNAVKYTTPGGVVHVRAKIVDERAIIEVEDSCGGLNPGDVEKAFAPFVRLNKSEPGYGLGLAITKQAIDAHGGTIRVQNLPGKGCIFILELPALSA